MPRKARRGGRLTSGAVITHLGITPQVLEANFRMMERVLRKYSQLFMELDFELLGPIPGSLAFDYLRRPGMARARADALGLNVNDTYLKVLHEKYRDEDELEPRSSSGISSSAAARISRWSSPTTTCAGSGSWPRSRISPTTAARSAGS